ncbi:MAG: sialate O-acetylesterase, partial [Planctomycetota bacterium]|nr:sialate O-acetylesterase [Planctomycetota bacterium]
MSVLEIKQPRLFYIITILFGSACPAVAEESKPSVKVFLLAGQSNMEGQGVVDLDHPKYYNGGRGILNRVVQNPEFSKRFPHLKNKGDDWVIRDDVWVRFKVKSGIKRGGLTIGFTGYEGKHHIGPEFQFGHLVGEHFDDPVLLIKTAWGGKSLF